MQTSALIVGASGIAGSNLASLLLAQGWTVYGLARRPVPGAGGMVAIAADLRDPDALRTALAPIAPTHVFITAWLRQDSEADNIRVNGGMVHNVLAALSGKGSVRHVALVTGLKHYLGPFDAYASSGTLPQTPLREDQPRLPLENFYYAQEDALYAAAARDGFAWTVHRPHTLIGEAVGNAMNMGSTLAVYASICKQTGAVFQFPGSQAQWQGISDVTDARQLARQLLWAAETPSAHDCAFNIVNGDVFRWQWLWGRLADWFGVRAGPFDGTVRPLEPVLAQHAGLWRTMAAAHGLIEPDMHRLASAWHTDLDLSRPLEVMTDMTRSRKLGFTGYQSTEDSFTDLFAAMRAGRLIP
jgi:nucleoside-diphosphate-sugar epimerase